MLTVTQGERTIARLNLPTTDQAPLVVPLNGAEVTGNWLNVTLRAYLVPLDGYCLYPESPLRLVNGTVNYTGTELPPTTVSHFLPPVLRKLTIYLPQSPSTAESDTAIQLATAAAAHYGKQAPDIVVVPLQEGQAAPRRRRNRWNARSSSKRARTTGFRCRAPPGCRGCWSRGR